MNIDDLWSTAIEALEALGGHCALPMEQVAAEFGLSGWYGGWLLPAVMFDPEPVSAARQRMRSPYTSARYYDERMEKAAGRGFLAPVAGAENDYRLTDLGRQAAKSLLDAMRTKMATLHPMPSTDLERLAGPLRRLVLSCLAAPEPPGKLSLLLCRRLDPGMDASVMARIDQYGGDLAAYRDDAHRASWQSLNLEGHAWEAFTLLWRAEAETLGGLCQKLERRAFTRDETRQALEGLIQRGWVGEEAGTYQATPAGREVRQAAEAATDRYFYAPWSCLSQAETGELRALLMRFRAGLLVNPSG